VSETEQTQNEDVVGDETLESEAAQSEEAAAEPTCEEKLKELEDRYLRTHAEFENIKKRLEKEKYSAIEYASEKFAKDLLPTLDALEAALKTDDKEQFDQLREGVQLTLDGLVKTFKKHGIEPVSHEAGFDPNIHEAVMQLPSEEHESGAIVQVMQQGYIYKERTLRPSLVSISQ